jgi:hypothetical protein
MLQGFPLLGDSPLDGRQSIIGARHPKSQFPSGRKEFASKSAISAKAGRPGLNLGLHRLLQPALDRFVSFVALTGLQARRAND